MHCRVPIAKRTTGAISVRSGLLSRRGGDVRSSRSSRVVICATQRSTKPPSMQPSATELESLERLSTIVPDTLLLREVSTLGKPKAASVSPRILASILASQGNFPVYEASLWEESTQTGVMAA